ncbi:TPA: hypothetical protein ACXNQL_002243 [Stenotrophomonas maltophilia]
MSQERPILFNGAMVRAILSGQKTQTRRVLKQATGPSLSVDMSEDSPGVAELSWLLGAGPGHDVEEDIARVPCPFGKPGDRLWVRESFTDLRGTGIEHRPDPAGPLQRYAYAADTLPGSNGDRARKDYGIKWRPSIHMPRQACRMVLEVTDVRVERLQAICEADAIAEGAQAKEDPSDLRWQHYVPHARGFIDLWNSTGGDWASNPWVWVVSFKVVTP